MNVLVLIIVNIIILNVWLRMSTTIFWQLKHPLRVWWALITWIIIALSLFFFPKIAWNYEKNTLLFLLYCFVWFIVLSWIITQKLSVRNSLLFLISCVILYSFTIFNPIIGLSSIVLYYIWVAWSEELLKFFSSKSFSTHSLLQSDIIIRSILLALWFSFLENIIYTLPAINNLWEAWSILINRWATGYLMHSIFTWTIAYLSIKRKQNKSFSRWTLWAVFIWITLHFCYNIIISQWIWWMTIPIIISGYVVLSYLLYSSDSIYLDEFSM